MCYKTLEGESVRMYRREKVRGRERGVLMMVDGLGRSAVEVSVS